VTPDEHFALSRIADGPLLPATGVAMQLDIASAVLQVLVSVAGDQHFSTEEATWYTTSIWHTALRLPNGLNVAHYFHAHTPSEILVKSSCTNLVTFLCDLPAAAAAWMVCVYPFAWVCSVTIAGYLLTM
jgi:hypothetical protein